MNKWIMKYLSFEWPALSDSQIRGLLLVCSSNDKRFHVINSNDQNQILNLIARIIESIPVPTLDLGNVSIMTIQLENRDCVVVVIEEYHPKEEIVEILKCITHSEEYRDHWTDVPEKLYGAEAAHIRTEDQAEITPSDLHGIHYYIIPTLTDLYHFTNLRGTLWEDEKSNRYLLATDQLLDDFFKCISTPCHNLKMIVKNIQMIIAT